MRVWRDDRCENSFEVLIISSKSIVMRINSISVLFSILFFLSLNTSVFSESISLATNHESIALIVPKDYEENLQVQIYDLKGEVLLSEVLNTKETKQRSYNLQNLPSGEYFMEIVSDKEIITRLFSYRKDVITIKEEKVINKPTFFKKNYTWTLSLLTFGKDATVKIYDDFGRELYTEEIKEQQSISRKYNMAKQRSGEYTIKVLVDDKSFYDRMIIN